MRATAMADLVMRAQNAVEAGFAGDIGSFVGQGRDNPGRRQFGKARFIGHGEDLGALGLAERMRWLRPLGRRSASACQRW